METIEISTNDWHYKLVDKFATVNGLDMSDMDSCQYNKTLFKSVLIIFIMSSFLLSAASFILYCLVDFVAWIAAYISYGVFAIPEGSAVAGMLMIFISWLITLFWLIDKYGGKIYRHMIQRTHIREKSGFDKLVESYKQKYCKKIKIRDSQ